MTNTSRRFLKDLILEFVTSEKKTEETMLRILMILCCVLTIIVHACSLVNNGVFRMYENKRFTSVTSTVMTSSRTGCANNCLRTNGCLAVSITYNYDVISCGLVTGPSDVLHDDGSNIYVFNSCAKGPAFCLNGGTCEVAMTGVRCRCADRYQGDRCDRCSPRFQGDECDTCVDGYHGDSCNITFSRHNDTTCHFSGSTDSKSFNDVEECRRYCANNNNCKACYKATQWSYDAVNACSLGNSNWATTYVKILGE